MTRFSYPTTPLLLLFVLILYLSCRRCASFGTVNMGKVQIETRVSQERTNDQ